MQRCLSTIELEGFLAGLLDATVQESIASHLAECDQCAHEFSCRTTNPNAADWQAAALAVEELSADESTFLELLKNPDSLRSAHPLSRDGLPESDWFQWDSLNGKKAQAAALIRRKNLAPPPPEIPGFEIIGQLGRGGMGVVYKARQISADRTVALKMILAGTQASPEDVGRFYDEASAVSQLRHPHFVQIHEVGQFEGRLFFVLEYVEGGTLADYIRQQPVPPRAAAQLMETLARAMHFAHERGIVHRDLKPANVLLHGRRAFRNVPDEADRQPTDWDFRQYMPKITDFGLAKLLDRSTGHTSSGDVLGTPSYMAPEQAQGKPYPISPTTDVYSLGAILYELLTGRPPFQGPSPMDTLFLVHTQEPEPPRRINKNVPAKLDAICLKCLKKSPGDRYRSAEALAEDLRLFLDGQPIRARGRNRLQQLWIRLRQRSGTRIFAALAAVLAVIAGASMIDQWRQNQQWVRQIEAIRAEHAAKQLEVLWLRFDRAIAECERGYRGRGLTELAILFTETDARTDARPLANLIRQNIAAWSQATPHLQSTTRSTIIPEHRGTWMRWLTGGVVIARSSDGRIEMIGTNDGWIRISTNGRLQSLQSVNRSAITQLSINPTNQWALSASSGEVVLWRLDPIAVICILPHPAGVCSIQFNDDGQTFYSIDAAGMRRVWQMPKEQVQKVNQALWPPSSRDDAAQIDVSNDKNFRLVQSADGIIQLRTSGDEIARTLEVPPGTHFRSAVFTSDSMVIATAWSDGIRLFDVATARTIGPVIPLPDVESVHPEKDSGNFVARRGTQSWRIETSRPVEGDLNSYVQRITGMARHPDGTIRWLDFPTSCRDQSD